MSKLYTPSGTKPNGTPVTHLEWLKLLEDYQKKLLTTVTGEYAALVIRELKRIRNQRRYLKCHGQGSVAYDN